MKAVVGCALIAGFVVDWSLRQLVQTQAYDIIILLLTLGFTVMSHNKTFLSFVSAQETEVVVILITSYKILLLYYYALSHDIASYLVGFVSSFVLLVLAIMFYSKEAEDELRKLMVGSRKPDRSKATATTRLESLM